MNPNDINNYQFSFTVRNEKNKKSIKSNLGSNGTIDGKNLWNVQRVSVYDDLTNYNIFPNDTIKIICEIKFVTYPQTKLENYVSDGDFKNTTPNLHKYLVNLFLEDQFSDVKLVTSCGKELKAHKNILASRSPTFAAMFTHDVLENKLNSVTITDVDYDILKEMLRFIYKDEIEHMETVANDLFIAADKYDIQDLKDECANYIANNINLENAIEIFELAAKYNAEKLKTQAMNFMKSSIDKMVKVDGFKEKIQVMGVFADFISLFLK